MPRPARPLTAGPASCSNDGLLAPLAPSTLAAADPIVVNEHEARALCRAAGRDSDDLACAVRAATGARSAVVTLGGDGALVAVADQRIAVPATRASCVVDTTGAGDTFVGTLAAALSRGEELVAAVRAATRAAASAVSWPGARPPARELPAGEVAGTTR